MCKICISQRDAIERKPFSSSTILSSKIQSFFLNLSSVIDRAHKVIYCGHNPLIFCIRRFPQSTEFSYPIFLNQLSQRAVIPRGNCQSMKNFCVCYIVNQVGKYKVLRVIFVQACIISILFKDLFIKIRTRTVVTLLVRICMNKTLAIKWPLLRQPDSDNHTG